MLSVAICDDESDQLCKIKQYVEDYLKSRNFTAEVQTFSHPDQLLAVCEKRRFHLYLLDIVMPMFSGLELGRDIRRMDKEAQIVFITSEPGFALNAFAVNPLDYLVKPVSREKIFSALELASAKIDPREDGAIMIKTKEGLRIISPFIVELCERVENTLRYTLVDGAQIQSLSIRTAFGEHVAPLLEYERFLQPHVSFIINMNRVVSLSERGFVMQSGITVPVAKKQYVAMRDTYLDYIFRRGDR